MDQFDRVQFMSVMQVIDLWLCLYSYSRGLTINGRMLRYFSFLDNDHSSLDNTSPLSHGLLPTTRRSCSRYQGQWQYWAPAEIVSPRNRSRQLQRVLMTAYRLLTEIYSQMDIKGQIFQRIFWIRMIRDWLNLDQWLYLKQESHIRLTVWAWMKP